MTIGAALRFDASEAEESVHLQLKLSEVAAGSLSVQEFTTQVTDLAPEHPLFDRVCSTVANSAG